MGRRIPGRETSQENIVFNTFLQENNIFGIQTAFSDGFNVLMSFLTENEAERFRNYFKKSALNPKHTELDQNSDFGHVRTYSWLNKLRNTQGKRYETYLRNIYGIYKEYKRNIHNYS